MRNVLKLEFDLLNYTLLVYWKKYPKTKIGKIVFWSKFETQIGRQHFFVIWQAGQTPDQFFFTNVSPNGLTGKSLYPNFVVFGPLTHFNQSLGPEV